MTHCKITVLMCLMLTLGYGGSAVATTYNVVGVPTVTYTFPSFDGLPPGTYDITGTIDIALTQDMGTTAEFNVITYALSLDARVMLGYVRGHWGIENQLHWPLDMTFREDTPRHRVGHSAENFSRIRRLALNLLCRDKTCKAGIKRKRLQACLKEDYLLRVLDQGI